MLMGYPLFGKCHLRTVLLDRLLRIGNLFSVLDSIVATAPLNVSKDTGEVSF